MQDFCRPLCCYCATTGRSIAYRLLARPVSIARRKTTVGATGVALHLAREGARTSDASSSAVKTPSRASALLQLIEADRRCALDAVSEGELAHEEATGIHRPPQNHCRSALARESASTSAASLSVVKMPSRARWSVTPVAPTVDRGRQTKRVGCSHRCVCPLENKRTNPRSICAPRFTIAKAVL